ncbi:hypothetical protein CEXT_773621 [Caerostris extrusa]|uniref:Uncharacterized protein n=1 Tax=Caerostris extrusa TaxID=172846 RepID=A0AAV4Q0C6_CAEEX|nr:hypothetical protein CEXT_773621 [Caerostris extrusa]
MSHNVRKFSNHCTLHFRFCVKVHRKDWKEEGGGFMAEIIIVCGEQKSAPIRDLIFPEYRTPTRDQNFPTLVPEISASSCVKVRRKDWSEYRGKLMAKIIIVCDEQKAHTYVISFSRVQSSHTRPVIIRVAWCKDRT